MKKKKGNLLLILSIVAVLGFGGAFAYHAYEYYLWWRDGQIAQENTDMVTDIFQEQMLDIGRLFTAMPVGAGENGPEEATIVFSAAPLDEARERTGNEDIVAYIFIEGTNINNVIVQGRDNEFYLYRDIFRNWNVNGSIFLDYRNTPDFNDFNTVVYGHNMNNGTMFHNLRYYMSRDFFEAHPNIVVILDERVLVYEIFSVFQTRIDFDYIQVEFESRREFGALVDEITRRRVYDTGVYATEEDRMLILSTCTNVDDDTRIVVAGRLAAAIDIEQY